MKTMTSTGISPGLALAQLKIIESTPVYDKDETFTTVEEEWNRFLCAQQQSIDELNELALKVSEDENSDMATLFETHALMAEDPDFEDAVREEIEQSLCTAPLAVIKAGDKLAQFFESMDDEYMQERSADVKDVAQRIATAMRQEKKDELSFSTPVILVAEDLTPSQTVLLDKQYVKGFILYKGTPNGHTGILARNLGIPAVIQPDTMISPNSEGKLVFIDGKTGEIQIELDSENEQACQKRIDMEIIEQNELIKYKELPTRTTDGRSVKIYCNIGSPADTNDVIENGGEGVGLFRSEFLYLGRDDYPTEEEQFESYVKTLKSLPDSEVIIRTCDIGSDKNVNYFSLPNEQNPALGTRAIRICLERKEMFKTQLRALYRASVYGNLAIMFPMISSAWELDEAKAIVKEVQDELKRENIPFNSNTKIGTMIETPAAAFISEELAHMVDFFSIGSNDLTQYTLACDRNSQLGRFYDPKHPAVLHLIEKVSKSAHDAGIPVGICGELAADESLTEFFLNIGIDELSVSPKRVMALRKKVNSL